VDVQRGPQLGQKRPIKFLPFVSVLTRFVGRFSRWAILDVAVLDLAMGRFGHIENLWAILVHGPFWCRHHGNNLFTKFAAVPGTSFHRLSVKNLYGAASSRVDLVIYHVLQTLVVRRTDEYLSRQLPASMSVV